MGTSVQFVECLVPYSVEDGECARGITLQLRDAFRGTYCPLGVTRSSACESSANYYRPQAGYHVGSIACAEHLKGD
jgi:hypothetical protein